MRTRALASIALSLLFGATSARAGGPFDDPYNLPTAPRPPTLPDLTHSELEATLETTFGVLVPNDASTSSTEVYAQRIGLEIPFAARRWFVGTQYEFAAGGGALGTSDFKVVSGNIELYGRTVWATRTGLAFGGGLGLMAPVATYDDNSPASRLASAATTLRPWDVSFFASGNFAIRPFVDVRVIEGRFTIQFREGLDFSFGTNDGYRQTTALTGLYAGYRITQRLSAGVEAFELYNIDGNIADALRANVVVSPSVRLMTPFVQPALSLFTNIGKTFEDSADRVWGLRIAATFVLDAPYWKRPIEE
jgi:hypothetical protein